MKKIIAILAAAAVVATTFTFAGCSKDIINDEDDAEYVTEEYEEDETAENEVVDENAVEIVPVENVEDENLSDEIEDAEEILAGEAAETEAVEDETPESETIVGETEEVQVEVEADVETEVKIVADEALTITDGKLTIATNAYFKPFEYYEGENIVGIDIEIAEAIAERLGLELIIEDMEFSSIITAVKTGAADMGIAGMTVTNERLENISFSYSYLNNVQSIIVRKDSDITSVDDLYNDSSYIVGVEIETTADIYCSDDFGKDRLVRYYNDDLAVRGLSVGYIDCVIIDSQRANALVAENEDLIILDTAYADEDYAICVAKENKELLGKINFAIYKLTKDGTIDAIAKKYIK